MDKDRMNAIYDHQEPDLEEEEAEKEEKKRKLTIAGLIAGGLILFIGGIYLFSRFWSSADVALKEDTLTVEPNGAVPIEGYTSKIDPADLAYFVDGEYYELIDSEYDPDTDEGAFLIEAFVPLDPKVESVFLEILDGDVVLMEDDIPVVYSDDPEPIPDRIDGLFEDDEEDDEDSNAEAEEDGGEEADNTEEPPAEEEAPADEETDDSAEEEADDSAPDDQAEDPYQSEGQQARSGGGESQVISSDDQEMLDKVNESIQETFELIPMFGGDVAKVQSGKPWYETIERFEYLGDRELELVFDEEGSKEVKETDLLDYIWPNIEGNALSSMSQYENWNDEDYENGAKLTVYNHDGDVLREEQIPVDEGQDDA